MQNDPLGTFCNTFDLHCAIIIISLENQSLIILRVAVLHRFNCIVKNPSSMFRWLI